MNFVFFFLPPIFIHSLYTFFSSFLFLWSMYLVAFKIFYFRLPKEYIWLIFLTLPIVISLLAHWTSISHVYLILPFIHSGIYIGCLLSLFLLLKMQSHLSNFSGGVKKELQILFCCLIFLFSLSDSFFIIWFSIPIILTLLWLTKQGDISQSFLKRVGGLILINSLFGYGLYKILNNYSVGIHLPKILPTLYTLSSILSKDIDVTIYLTVSLFIAVFCFFCFFKSKPLESDARNYFLSSKIFWTWNFFSILTTFFLVFTCGIFLDVGSFRYFQPLIFNPLFIIIWILIRLLEILHKKYNYLIRVGFNSLLVTLSFIIVLALPYYFNIYQHTRQYQLYECLKNDGVGIVYSDYWNSQSNYVFSQGKIIPRQINDDGSPYRFNNNNAWYTLRPSQPYKIAILEDTSFGKQTFTNAEIKTCNGFTYKLLPEDTKISLPEK